MTSNYPLIRFVFKPDHVQFSERFKELEVCLLLFISIFPLKYGKLGATYAVLHASRKSSRIMVSYAIVSICGGIREVHKKLGLRCLPRRSKRRRISPFRPPNDVTRNEQQGDLHLMVELAAPLKLKLSTMSAISC